MLRGFSQDSSEDFCDGIIPGGLIHGSDGILYGITGDGGIAGNRTIFSCIPPAVLLKSVVSDTGRQITIIGIAEHTYKLQRATALLGPWSDLGNLLLDKSGVGHFEDHETLAAGAFYRVTNP